MARSLSTIHSSRPESLFFTRWITHFCAPVFVFLAGTSAGLMTARRTPAQLGGFLFRRGCWLILIEITVVALAWTFAPTGIAEVGGQIVIPMQVIWVIGLGMVVLSGAQWLGAAACLTLGLIIVMGHNLLDGHWPVGGLLTTDLPWWVPLHAQAAREAGSFLFVFSYPALPWIGVMLLGFATARVFAQPEPARDRQLWRAGLVVTAGFVALRALDFYGEPNGWQSQAGALRTVIDFLNVSKYPPSLLYVLMTLGPAAMLCARAERLPGFIKRPLIVFGRVPFVFYIAHLYLIHGLSVMYGWVTGFDVQKLLTVMVFYPREFGVPLPGVYAVWVIVVFLLYPLCRWMAAVKARRRDWWLSYL